jgi:hypothetical protein
MVLHVPGIRQTMQSRARGAGRDGSLTRCAPGAQNLHPLSGWMVYKMVRTHPFRLNEAKQRASPKP